ncbi:MAG: molybdopterin molybdotransferase MoeA [Defluviitaleaceae bacterium]|nr:molybdopterin molybdotransferase MoeA [Defluviitaleaceae bacterium]
MLLDTVEPQTQVLEVPLPQALGLHIAQDVYAPIDVPTFNRAGVDGYALRASRTEGASKEYPVRLKVQAELMAGDICNADPDDTQCVRIMTGCQVPGGFDAVIRQEETNGGGDQVEIYTGVKPFANLGMLGEDISKGQLVITRSTKLTPIHIGILASLGLTEVEALKPPRIGLISSGSELAELGKPLLPGQIYCSNRHVLAARLSQLNTDVVVNMQHRDNVGEFSALIEEHIGKVDMLVTTGAVSVGKMDIMHDVLTTLGAARLFRKVNMRPGTPVIASIYRGKPILSLSGNPLAAVTTFELLFRPMLCAFLQSDAYAVRRVKGTLMDRFGKESRQRRFVNARFESGRVYLGAGDRSSVLSSMLGCNCFVDIPAGTPALQQGQEVEVALI